MHDFIPISLKNRIDFSKMNSTQLMANAKKVPYEKIYPILYDQFQNLTKSCVRYKFNYDNQYNDKLTTEHIDIFSGDIEESPEIDFLMFETESSGKRFYMIQFETNLSLDFNTKIGQVYLRDLDFRSYRNPSYLNIFILLYVEEENSNHQFSVMINHILSMNVNNWVRVKHV